MIIARETAMMEGLTIVMKVIRTVTMYGYLQRKQEHVALVSNQIDIALLNTFIANEEARKVGEKEP